MRRLRHLETDPLHTWERGIHHGQCQKETKVEAQSALTIFYSSNCLVWVFLYKAADSKHLNGTKPARCFVGPDIADAKTNSRHALAEKGNSAVFCSFNLFVLTSPLITGFFFSLPFPLPLLQYKVFSHSACWYPQPKKEKIHRQPLFPVHLCKM